MFLLALTMLGCGPPTPSIETFPVMGKVVGSDGKAFPGGAIEFRSQSAQPFNAFGEIQSDGSFTLYTVAEGSRAAGAIAGTHRVTIVPAMDHTQAAQPITLSDVFTVERSANDFTITVPSTTN